MKRASLLLVLLAVTFTLAAGARNAASARLDPTGLIAHEWGTFTSVAGEDGRAVEWLPLGGPVDLPCFVDRYNNSRLYKVNLGSPRPLTYETARADLRGKVRMETPVIYFYAQQAGSVDVRVTFPRGLMTEWYPRATVKQRDFVTGMLSAPDLNSTIEWRNVKVDPRGEEAFPTERGDSHYYAARDTDAAPIDVNGQREKFLFYRGVAGFDVPIAAIPMGDGAVRVKSLSPHGVRAVVLFENRGGTLRYRVHGALKGEATIGLPAGGGNAASIRADLERILTDAGLFPKEARAMVATWGDSWFEEGTRVFYVLAPRDVDAVLPLRIDPSPSQVARVFVGRMEVLTPAVMTAVRAAIAADDKTTLQRYGRFLGATADRLIAGASPQDAERIKGVTKAAFADYVARFPDCRPRL